MKKVLIFSTAYLPLIGGAEIAVKEITKRLPDWQFDLITAKIKPGLSKFEKIGNINVYRVGLGLGFLDKLFLPIFGLIRAVKLNGEREYNFIWSIMASQAGVAAVFFKIWSKKKLLLTLQEGDPEKHLERYVGGMKFLYKIFIKPWHTMPFKYADYLTVISNYLKKRALRNGVKVPIKIVPNGVDLKTFKPVERIDNQKEKIILTVSRLVKKNGIDDLIKAGQYLDFPFKIIIIGVGPDEEKLKKLANNLKIQNKVIFQGKVNYNELPIYYSTADVFVRASRSEGLGNVFLEAMACGLPVIGTEVGGIPDFLKNSETGLFCEANNPQDIAQKIKEILKDDNLGKYLRENGLELVREKYSWDKISQQMENIYLKLINEE